MPTAEPHAGIHEEALAGLQRERRGGAAHFVPGQIRAWRSDPDPDTRELPIAVLRWVDRMGHAWVMLCELQSAGWVAELATRVGQSARTPWAEPPPAFRMTGAMLEALENAGPICNLGEAA